MGSAFGTVHTSTRIRRHPSAFVATRISGSSLGVSVNVLLHDRCTPSHVNQSRAHLLSQGANIRDMAPLKDLWYSLRFGDNQY